MTNASTSPPPGPRIAVFLASSEHRSETGMSACERATIATGVSLRAQLGGSLTCIALDSDDTTGLLLNASLAEGADRAVQIHAPECAGLDYFGIANVLAEIAVRLGCDLALCAEHDEHGALYAFGPAMAEILGLRYLSGLTKAAVLHRLSEVVAK